MFCTVCGHDLEEGVRYCTRCGSPAGFPSDGAAHVDPSISAQANASVFDEGTFCVAPHPCATVNSVPTSWNPAPESLRMQLQPASPKKGRGWLVVLVALLLAGAAVAALAIAGMPQDQVSEARFFGSSEPMRCSSATRIVPYAAEGKPMGAYQVELVPLDVEGDVPKDLPLLYIEGDSGFSLSGFGDLPSGTYGLAVTDDASSQTYAVPIVEKVEDEAAQRWEVKPNPEGGDAVDRMETMYRLYYSTCSRYQTLYGTASHHEAAGSSIEHLEGLCFAQLVDFNGDGMEELALAYYDPERDTGSSRGGSATYRVEVWEYRNATLRCVYEGEPFGTNGSVGTVHLVSLDGASYIEQGAADSFYEGYLFGYRDGSFGRVKSLECNYATDVFMIDGADVAKGEFESTRRQWEAATRYYGLNGSSACKETQDEADATVKFLAEQAGIPFVKKNLVGQKNSLPETKESDSAGADLDSVEKTQEEEASQSRKEPASAFERSSDAELGRLVAEHYGSSDLYWVEVLSSDDSTLEGIVRYTGGSTPNVLVTSVSVDKKTGKVVDDSGEFYL